MTDTDVLTPEQGHNPVGENSHSSQADSHHESKESTSTARGLKFNSLNIPQLRSIAAKAGIEGTSAKRKSELVAAIESAVSAGKITIDEALSQPARKARTKNTSHDTAIANAAEQAELTDKALAATGLAPGKKSDKESENNSSNDASSSDTSTSVTTRSRTRRRAVARPEDTASTSSDNAITPQDSASASETKKATSSEDVAAAKNQENAGSSSSNNSTEDGENTGGSGRRRRSRRNRDRRRSRGGNANNYDNNNSETDRSDRTPEEEQLQNVAGILDVLDNYAFLRTTGYLPGTSDVYVSMNMVRRFGLRRGDHIVGMVKTPKESDANSSRQKFNPLVKIEAINGKDFEEARKRPDFSKLVPLYPNERLRLETEPNVLTTRIIDIVMPIGKGQRALIVSPPKAGKTTILQNMANAIATNNPECYLMVVLVDERPEEVTDMQRSVHGEVISSTFDRPPSDHTAVAELAIERAKRLVEDGEDVVVLLDSITRLGRAYNNSTPASGRILSGGLDSTALYPPKRFLGAARNIEDGGSLTIIATAMVETGSTGDTVIFEEFKGTGNAELKLDRKIAERRIFPAVDVNPSSTRKDELLLSNEEAQIVHKLRRVLSGLDSHQAIELLISQLKKTRSNVEFLLSVNKTTPGMNDERTE